MKCIYDKEVDCIVCPGKRTKDFECLNCFKPKNKSLSKGRKLKSVKKRRKKSKR